VRAISRRYDTLVQDARLPGSIYAFLRFRRRFLLTPTRRDESYREWTTANIYIYIYPRNSVLHQHGAELGVSGKNSLRRLPQSLPVLDKTDNPDDADPGRQVGAFLTADSWNRFRLPGQVRFLPHRRRTSECWERIS